MFGKRKTPVRPATTQSEPTQGVGGFSTVIVPRSAFEAARNPEHAHRLVAALVDFVNTMTGRGFYTRDELLPKATQAFHADYYLAQVNNGGHGQFIHNSFANIDYALADVRTAVTAIGAEPYASIVERLIASCAERRDPVTRKIDLGFRERADKLGVLDDEFYAANRTAAFSNLLAGWIAAWPELRVVDDADYPEAMRLSATMNPLREVRRQWKSVSRLQFQTTDRFQVGVGLACAHIEVPEIRLHIGAGVGMEIEGAKQIGFSVRTNAEDLRCCVVTPEYAAAYEYIPANVPNIPNMYTDPNVMVAALNDGRLSNITGPRAGARLSRINAALIDDVISEGQEHRAGLAMDLLLRKAGIETDDAQVAGVMVVPDPQSTVVRWMLLAANQPLRGLTKSAGAALVRWGDTTPFVQVTRRELDAHAERVAAGSMAAKPL